MKKTSATVALRFLRLVLLLLCLSPIQAAQACSCPVPRQNPDEGFEKISMVFSGKLISTRRVEGWTGTQIRSRWLVTQSIKGLALTEVEIDSPPDSAQCGLPDLRIGMHVTLAARGSLRQGFRSDSCTWNQIYWPRLTRYQAERQELQTQLQNNPENTTALMAQGELFLSAGEFDDAIKSFTALLKLAPDMNEARLGRAKALRAVGAAEAARLDEVAEKAKQDQVRPTSGKN
ncbi:tetratricopeptide repeat protein [Paucibacter sp. TC2R-5]|uniref:tetratricopeptide repeat protein n=1 Tax=Paucibacter sp. TC2R-5 TaxID=2893555 RepID=UPI0021E3F4FF|nr:tetratricopeptide repeat protein [Paucibacter sp. TC2R-5]MCV2360700.1 tetratricopeptide repeat protein [Paucibacter sp. TC2R-5]